MSPTIIVLNEEEEAYPTSQEQEWLDRDHPKRCELMINLLENLFEGNMERALDVACGDGRLSREVLVWFFNKVDLFDCQQKQLDKFQKWSRTDEQVGTVEIATMQDYDPKETYDLIAMNWCLGYVTDEDVVKVLRKFKGNLRAPDKKKTRADEPSSFIIVLDNVKDRDLYDDNKQGKQRLRSPETFQGLFREAGLIIHGNPK